MKGNDFLEYIDIDGRIVLKSILNNAVSMYGMTSSCWLGVTQRHELLDGQFLSQKSCC
jgi:hypothetical protein